ncbi:MAG: DUF190 domain-containing protein [Nitrospirae bacterium]|nr:MAG: DUF190 domain-containing protein [Nitrospirota bacterium]
MLSRGPAKKLTVYVDEGQKHGRLPAHEALVDLLHRKGVAGVTVFRGVAGYGAGGEVHTSRSLVLSLHMPVKIEAIDRAEQIDRVLPDVIQIAGDGLVEVNETNVVHCCATAKQAAQAAEERPMKLTGKAKILRVIVSEEDEWEGEPLYEAICKRLVAMDVAGATVYKAVAGYGPHRRFHKIRLLARDKELPVQVTVVDTEEKIREVLPVLDEMVHEGLVVLSDAEVIKYTHRDAG